MRNGAHEDQTRGAARAAADASTSTSTASTVPTTANSTTSITSPTSASPAATTAPRWRRALRGSFVRERLPRPVRERVQRIPRPVVLGVIWAVLFVTIAGGIASGIQIFSAVSRARADATDAVHHLDALRALVPASATSGKLTDLAPLLNKSTMQSATRELTAADAAFVRLRADLAPVGGMAIVGHTPKVGDALTAAWLLADAGDHGSRAGLLLLADAQSLLSYLHGGIFGDGKGTPLTIALITRLQSDLRTATSDLDQAVADINAADLGAIPSSLLKPTDVALLRKVASQWPSAHTHLNEIQPWLAVLPSIAGIGTPVSYFVEVMDSGELRPGGGFIGNYAILTLKGGQIEPFNLTDTYLLDRPYLDRVNYQSPVPAQYGWWPWQGYFGLRDSNLSPDFPTNAQVATRLLAAESGQHVQGVMAITPPVIERILQVLGPIPMPLYGVTVNSDNLVQLIEYYQLAVSPQTGLPPADQISSASKRFTALVGRALMAKLHDMSTAQLLAVGQSFLTDVQQKDLQIYLSDPASEELLAKTGYTNAVPHTPGDAVTVSDANDGVNKASQFTTTTIADNVHLDAQGNATHDLTITYRFHAANVALVYGPDRYLTYLRVYAPPGSQLKALTGLSNMLGEDQIGHSDLSWRQMWGGYVVVPDGVAYSLRFTWVVPHAATKDSQGVWHYTITYQRQPGAHEVLHVNVSVPGRSAPVATYSGTLLSDQVFSATYH